MSHPYTKKIDIISTFDNTEYAFAKPLTFTALFLLLGSPIYLSVIDVFITPLPTWFFGFIFVLAFVFAGFGQLYEKGSDPDRYEDDQKK